ncbi:hypothetical protein [Leptospira licerasiae]|uniref:hypothetical protein n=1 Tax=Leptospira licerasiae TaxID=447106 RepID=UPI000248BC87|nr:hypothetical protein [Leptospira licerasiae]EIE01482.1 hypothetical protein LEP1GSC185_3970 [Leptospira licerasiae serovar Varillal str. VAR 010]
MLEEISKEIKAALYERIRDPLLGSFLSASLFWNWQPISILLFGEENIVLRINYILTAYYSNALDRLWSIVPPFSISLFYTFIYPFFKIYIVKFTSWTTKKIKESKEQYENYYRLTSEQSNLLKSSYQSRISQISDSVDLERRTNEVFAKEIENYFAIASNINLNNVKVRRYPPEIKEGSWVFESHGSVILTAQNRSGSIGLVVKVINENYCLIISEGRIADIFRRTLVPGKTYYLDMFNPGEMIAIEPKIVSYKVGVAISTTVFQIEFSPFTPGE